MAASRLPVCVFAKTPRRGQVKTRLAATVGAPVAVALARAFLADTWNGLRRVRWARPVLALSGRARGLPPLGGLVIARQGAGDLGARLERVLRGQLARSQAALAIGADTPGLPARLLRGAHRALIRADAVLGPASDGGFYLLGLRRCPRGLLHGLRWSADDTFARTHARLRQRGLTVLVLAPWFDVDREPDLARLATLLAARRLRAPETARLLRSCVR